MTKEFRNFSSTDANIYLLEAGDRIIPSYSESLAKKSYKFLNDLGVKVMTKERVENIEEMKVTTNKQVIYADNIIWAAGNEASPLIKYLDTETDNEGRAVVNLSLIHISEPTRLGMISYAVFCLKKKK